LWHDPGAITSGKRQLGKRTNNTAQLLPVFFAQTQRHLPLRTRVPMLRHPSSVCFLFSTMFSLKFPQISKMPTPNCIALVLRAVVENRGLAVLGREDKDELGLVAEGPQSCTPNKLRCGGP
jgi:hypothetical protein